MTDMKEALEWALEEVRHLNANRLNSDDPFWLDWCRAENILKGRDDRLQGVGTAKEALGWTLDELQVCSPQPTSPDDPWWGNLRRAKAILEGRDPDGEDGG